MRHVALLGLLVALAACAPAGAAGWGAPRTLLPGATAAGLEPRGGAGAYIATTLGRGRARAFALRRAAAPRDLDLFPHGTGTVALASAPGHPVLTAAENGGGTLLVHRLDPDGADRQSTVPMLRAEMAAVGAGGTAAVGDSATFVFAPPGAAAFDGPVSRQEEPPYTSDLAVAPDGTVCMLVATDGSLTLYEDRPDGSTRQTHLAGYDVARGDAVPAASLAAGARGALAAVWTQPAGPQNRSIRATLLARTRPAHGRFGQVQQLDTSRSADLAPQVALLRDGRAVAVWASAHDRGAPSRPRALRAAFTAPGPGYFGPFADVSSHGAVRDAHRPSISGRDAGEPDLAVGADGGALVAWSEGCVRCDTKVAVAAASPTGRFGAPRVLSRLGAIAEAPRVALDGAGGAGVAWTQRDAVTRANRVAVVARTPRLPTRPARRDVRPPRIRLRPLASLGRALRSGRLRVRFRCSEACSLQIGGAIAATRGVVVVNVARGDARDGFLSIAYAATDRAGNLARGRLRVRR